MSSWRALVLFLMLVVCGTPARAQDAGKIFDFLQNQIQNEINRKQQRQFERNQRQLFETERQNFLNSWRQCFDNDDIIQCDVALAYAHLSDTDRARILAKRNQIVAIQQQTERAARQEQYEREQRARQAAEADARRREHERKLAEERERAEQARAREATAQKAAERGVYERDLAACKAFSAYSCDHAGLSPLATDQERARIASWRQTAVTYVAVREDCRNGTLAACDVALASPALTAADRSQIEEWRIAASPLLRITAAVSNAGSSTLNATQAAVTSFRDLPVSTHVMTAIAASLAIALGLIGFRQRTAGASRVKLKPHLDTAQTISAAIPRAAADAITSAPRSVVETGAEPTPTKVNLPAIPEKAPTLAPVDTAAAMRALALANSYVDEVAQSSNSDDRPAIRTTLALAARQLDIAADADPNARLSDDDGNEVTQSALRARVLVQEALTWPEEKLAKACAIAEKACAIDPLSAHAHYIAGWLNFEHKNRTEAIGLLERAVELSPSNMDAVKLLDRAQNMTATEIAAYKSQVAGLSVANTGVKVYNTGVGIYNVGVFFWNVLVFVLRVITFPVRVMEGLFRLFTR